MSKIEDQYLHTFSPTGMGADQILTLFSCHYHMLNMGKKGIIIHTSKDLFETHHDRFVNTEKDILKFWSTFEFIKGIIFDVDQRTLPTDAAVSNYNIFPYLDFPYNDDYQCNLAEHIDFSLFPKRFNQNLNSNYKTAILQPVSLKNKPVALKNDFIAEWDESVAELIKKGYWIYMIGSDEDSQILREIHDSKLSSFTDKSQVTNLMGRLDMFESIDLVMNKADFVMSCCSWSGWYGIASRKKTAMAIGPLMEEGKTDRAYVNCMKNKDIFFMDYSSKKEETDKNIARWIKDNV